MKIEISRESGSGGVIEVTLSHGNHESTTWNTSMHDRTKIKDRPALFKHLNAYWAHLPEEKQERIWEIYQAMAKTFATVFDDNLITLLLKNIRELFDVMTPEDISKWMSLRGNAGIPSAIQDNYTEEGRYGSIKRFHDRTCLRADYRNFIYTALALRALMPVFGEYISRTEKINGAVFKEMMALPLISGSQLWDMPGVQWLIKYVDATLEQEKASDSAIIGGIGPSERPDWLLAKILIRRLTTEEFPVNGDDNNIMINIYHVVRNSLKNEHKSLMGPITSKFRNDADMGDDQERISRYEQYKERTNLSQGDMAPNRIWIEDYVAAAQRLDPTIEPAMVESCVNYARKQDNSAIHEHSLALIKYVVDPAVSAKGIDPLLLPTTLVSAGVTQALLWHWGFFDLAALVTARRFEVPADAMASGPEQRNRVPKDLAEELTRLYPHFVTPRGGRPQTERKKNMAYIAIDIMAELIFGFEWTLTCPPALAKLSNRITNDRMVAPADLRAQLAKLIIERIA